MWFLIIIIWQWGMLPLTLPCKLNPGVMICSPLQSTLSGRWFCYVLNSQLYFTLMFLDSTYSPRLRTNAVWFSSSMRSIRMEQQHFSLAHWTGRQWVSLWKAKGNKLSLKISTSIYFLVVEPTRLTHTRRGSTESHYSQCSLERQSDKTFDTHSRWCNQDSLLFQ